MNRSVFSVVAALVLVGCGNEGQILADKGTDGVAGPEIQLDPLSLEYSTLSQGESETKAFVATNIGSETLHVTDVTVAEGDRAFTVVGGPLAFDLEPGAEREIEVQFTPAGADENYGTVVVHSDATNDEAAEVALLGYGAVPDLVIEPQDVVLEAAVPCGESVELTLTNVGTEALEITGMDYESGGLLSVDPGSVPPPSAYPIVLQPGEHGNVWIDFTAATEGSDTGTLTVRSNDPGGPETATQNGEGQFASTASETFTEPGVPPVDVLLLIDQSCSMSEDNTDDVETGIPDFVAELEQVSDWRLMLVTDGRTGCGTGGIIDENTPNPADLIVRNAFPGYGFGLPGLTEALLELADRALSKTGPGECNEGFLRPGALLHVIVVSDEREHSGNNGQYWVTQLESYVSAPDFLKISGVLDVNTNCGDGSGARGYDDAVALTGGATLNICNANWGSQFSGIASEVLAGVRAYNLSESPDPGSVEVTVNGNRTTDFDVTGDNVTINSPPVGEGDVVEVEYGVLAECN